MKLLFAVLSFYSSSVLGFSEISLDLSDFKKGEPSISMIFDILLPEGQKLNLGAQSQLKVEEGFGDSQWRTLEEVDINKAVHFLGNLEPVTIKPQLSPQSSKIRVTGTLYHCPKKDVKGSKSYCVIQPIIGVAKASNKGVTSMTLKIIGSMLN